MNFIIYTDEEVLKSGIEDVIGKVMIKSKLDYKIFYNSNDNTGNKVYIIDELYEHIDLVKNIRCNDWNSPIVILNSNNKIIIDLYDGEILMLDYICKKNYKKYLKKYLKGVLNTLNLKNTYNFSYKGDYFSLPYSDILYFEKNINDNSSIVVCEDDDYIVRKTIREIVDEVDNDLFIKTHRSCVVNREKITKVDYDNGIIYFKNYNINLLSRSNKKVLKDKLISN